MNEHERIQLLADIRETEMAVIAMLNAPSLFDNKISQNITLYRIQRHDRIERIARMYNTTVDQIVKLNNLEYPFIDSDPDIPLRSNIASVGDEIAIPSDKGIEATDLNQESLEEKKYGVDLYFDFDAGDLVIDDTEADVKLVSGMAMIIQQIKIMFRTRVGRIIDFLMYGNPLIPGFAQNAWRIAMDKINLINALKSDIRITSATVDQVSGSGRGDTEYQWTVQVGGEEYTDKVDI